MELTSGRNFQVYADGMDASLHIKLAELLPHIRPGLIVDVGCAGGSLIAALLRLFPDSRFIGIDCSSKFVEQARARFANDSRVTILEGKAEHLDQLVLEPASTVILASITHEIHSYNNYDETPVLNTFACVHNILEQGGVLLVRDGIAPSRAVVGLWCNPEDGASHGPIDQLSTHAMFQRFLVEYRDRIGVSVDLEFDDGRCVYLLNARDAYEFINKKDYRANWAQEVNEQYGFWRKAEWLSALQKTTFVRIDIQEIVNPWIVRHRFNNHVLLLDPRTFTSLPWFPTHAVIVAYKS